MKKLFYAVLLFSFFGFSQEKLTITKDGFTPLVVEVSGLSSQEIYLKTKEWLQVYYKNPQEVLKADIPNEMIRINGFAVDGYKMKNLGMVFGYDYDYVLEIQFKEGKYRFNYIVNQFWSLGKQCLYGYQDFWKKDGTIKTKYQLAFDSLNESANQTNTSILEYVTGKTKAEKKDW